MHWLEEVPIAQFYVSMRKKHVVGFAIISFIGNCSDSVPFLRHQLLNTHFLSNLERWYIFGMLVELCFDLKILQL